MPHDTTSFFLLGCGRSGTTMLASVLNAHPGIVIPPETWWLPMAQALGLNNIDSRLWYRVLMGQLKGTMRTSPQPAIANFCDGFLKKYYTFNGHYSDLLRIIARELCESQSAQMFGEKTPAHTTFMGELNKSFPDFKKIILLRDPRDVVLSYFTSFLAPSDENLANVLKTLKVYLFNILNCAEGDSLVVRYEDLTKDTAPELARIVTFLGLDPGLIPARSILPIVRAEGVHKSISKPPFPNDGKYRTGLEPRHAVIVEAMLRLEMERMNYPLDHSPGELQQLRLPACFRNFQETVFARLQKESFEKLSENWRPAVPRYRALARHLLIDRPFERNFKLRWHFEK
jgi:sulfotransferase family protein